MIRFKPDDWVDVVMRPFDMISPESGIYIEIAAPDIRMAVAVILGLLTLLFWGHLKVPRKPVFVLLALMTFAFLPWLITSGNGRYFMAFLVLSGPLCFGLARLLPVSQAMRLTLCALILAVQAYLVVVVVPFNTWGWVQWRESPYFEVESPPKTRDMTYVTISSISYSLIGPQFPPEASWINVSSGRNSPRDVAAVRRFLAIGRPLMLVVHSLPEETLPDGRPSEKAVDAFNSLLRWPGLSIKSDRGCELLRSGGIARLLNRQQNERSSIRPVGFWLCPLQLGEAASLKEESHKPDDIDAVFEKVENLCPRFFLAGNAETLRINSGYMRMYGDSDTRVYVMDDGNVRYKYWRALNAVSIGDVDAVRSGRAHVDCTKIRALNWRDGGP